MKATKPKYNISKNSLLVVMIVNVILALIDKGILLMRGAWGAPLIITAILWFFIFKGRKWAFVGFYIVSGFVAILGLLGIVLLIGYIYRGYDILPCVLMIVMGCNYAIAAFLLNQSSLKLSR